MKPHAKAEMSTEEAEVLEMISEGGPVKPAETATAEAHDSDRLQHCLQALPERERSVIVMTFYEDLPAETLGAQFGLTPGNVRVIRHRALAKLSTCLQAKEAS